MALSVDDSVPVEVIRDAIQASGVSWSELARRLGWFRLRAGRSVPDDMRVRRHLGLHPSYSHGAVYPRQRRVGSERAVELLRAANIDPMDVGL
jgi:hypothetical protein